MTMTQRSNDLMHICHHRQTLPMKSTTFDKPSEKNENRWIVITLDFDNSPKHVNLVTLRKRSKSILS